MNPRSVLVMLDPLSLPRLEAILAYAREHRWAVILEDRLPEGGLNRIDGALVSLRGRKEQLRKVKSLLGCGKPVVDLTVVCPTIKLPRVISDHAALGSLAAQHFLERNFVDFAWYASDSSHVHDLRRQGYASSLRRAGFNVSNLSDLSKLPDLPHPLAILAFDESDAAHVIEMALSQGLDVPEEIAVLGIGNDPFLCENGSIKISSVDQNLARAAHEACALLDKLMADRLSNPAAPNAQNAKRSNLPFILIPPAGVIPRASTETLSHPDPTIRAALVYIHRHLYKAFGAIETAEAIGVARSTLDHLFTEKIGHSIGREILIQRLTRAKRLLKDPTIPLRKIASACGFCNASYFTNIFRREIGMRPRDWRKVH